MSLMAVTYSAESALEETARSLTGVNGIGEACELDASPVQFTNQINEVLNATFKPIGFPRHEGWLDVSFR